MQTTTINIGQKKLHAAIFGFMPLSVQETKDLIRILTKENDVAKHLIYHELGSLRKNILVVAFREFRQEVDDKEEKVRIFIEWLKNKLKPAMSPGWKVELYYPGLFFSANTEEKEKIYYFYLLSIGKFVVQLENGFYQIPVTGRANLIGLN